jgi:hypothetical protein
MILTKTIITLFESLALRALCSAIVKNLIASRLTSYSYQYQDTSDGCQNFQKAKTPAFFQSLKNKDLQSARLFLLFLPDKGVA